MFPSLLEPIQLVEQLFNKLSKLPPDRFVAVAER
jgi:hypothetical protein